MDAIPDWPGTPKDPLLVLENQNLRVQELMGLEGRAHPKVGVLSSHL